jgi:hypothetical protein
LATLASQSAAQHLGLRWWALGHTFSIRLPGTWHFYFYTEKINVRLLWVPVFLVLHDYLKSPIDRLYFQNPLRPLVGMRNTLVDIVLHKFDYDTMDYPNLWFVKANYNKILFEYEKGLGNAQKKYFHNLDPWFKKNKK